MLWSLGGGGSSGDCHKSVELSSWFGRKKVSKVRPFFPASDPFGLPCWPSGNLFFSTFKLSSNERTLSHTRGFRWFVYLSLLKQKKSIIWDRAALIPTWVLCTNLSSSSSSSTVLSPIPALCTAGPISAAVPFSKFEAFVRWRQVEEEAPSCQHFLPSWHHVSSSEDAWWVPGLQSGRGRKNSAFFCLFFWIIKQSIKRSSLWPLLALMWICVGWTDLTHRIFFLLVFKFPRWYCGKNTRVC